jgi:hypothetical protein
MLRSGSRQYTPLRKPVHCLTARAEPEHIEERVCRKGGTAAPRGGVGNVPDRSESDDAGVVVRLEHLWTPMDTYKHLCTGWWCCCIKPMHRDRKHRKTIFRWQCDSCRLQPPFRAIPLMPHDVYPAPSKIFDPLRLHPHLDLLVCN